MSDIPSELKYSETHEWAHLDDEDQVRVGITDHAQQLLGDIVFIELPEIDTEVKAGDECAVIESVKAASDIYSPVSGTIIAVNELLEESPELVNSDPYGDGWLFIVAIEDETELDELNDSDDYAEQINE